MKNNLGSSVKVGTRYGRSALSLGTYLRFLERILLSRTYYSEKPQLFIFGLPRSGTTLIYQYIAHRLQVAYFTNGVGKYPHAPCLITFLQHSIYRDYQSDFTSRYGKVSGPVAPREAGSFWGRFFGFDEYVKFADMRGDDIHLLRNTIACIQKIYDDAPFVNKNVKHMLRLDAISRTFPNSYFLLVERDLSDVALSILRGRYTNLKNPRDWWSIKPPNYEEIKDLSVIEQVEQQIISLNRQIESDLSRVSSDRILRIQYEEFCDYPENLISGLNNIFGSIDYKNPEEKSFERTSSKPETVEEQQLLAVFEHGIS